MTECEKCPQRGIESVTCDECGVPMAEHSGEVSCCGPANGAMAALLRATQEALVEFADGTLKQPWGLEHAKALDMAREAVG